ncbi:SGNH/GDSL hydrolase family protein [Pseudarthrobacter chlorophenolicus]|uniref:SGNH/GDSL hydrolase family protein n=1 Tax=Pseudarthrobacter chlorophenolicus TaxID=85085 RepID=UPI0005F2A96C|nr:SGNH/GDSL hydrolase family protein [Pseudarthrobacter chlorophenolicus]
MGTTALRRRRTAFAASLAALAMALGSTALPAGAAPPDKDVDLVAVGDSYTAGIGAGYTTLSSCTQTNGGYVTLLKALPMVDDSSTNAACAGAVIIDKPADTAPSVLEQIAALTASGTLSVRTELVTVTAGANDIDFTMPLKACAGSPLDVCAQAVQAVKAKFPAMQASLVEALTAIRKAAPHATIAVFGYPLLFDPYGRQTLLGRDAQKLVNAGTLALDSAIAQATDAPRVKAKAVYVDVTQAFENHAVNSAYPWINFNPADPFSLQNFHPTAAGHQAYVDALSEAVDLNKLARP